MVLCVTVLVSSKVLIQLPPSSVEAAACRLCSTSAAIFTLPYKATLTDHTTTLHLHVCIATAIVTCGASAGKECGVNKDIHHQG